VLDLLYFLTQPPVHVSRGEGRPYALRSAVGEACADLILGEFVTGSHHIDFEREVRDRLRTTICTHFTACAMVVPMLPTTTCACEVLDDGNCKIGKHVRDASPRLDFRSSSATSSTRYTMKNGKQVRTTTRAGRRDDAERDNDDDMDVDKEE
jgi:hypothetical protein